MYDNCRYILLYTLVHSVYFHDNVLCCRHRFCDNKWLSFIFIDCL